MTDARARDNDSDALPDVRNEGQRAMRLVPGSLSSIASALGVDKGTVSRWRSGEKVPSPALRERIHAMHAIDPGAWDRRPGGQRSAPSSATESGERPATGLELCEAQLDRLHRLLGDDLAPSEQLKVEQLINAAVKTKEGIEARAELLEARIVREHPVWRRIVAGLAEVLRPHPDAAEAVASFLADIEADA